ncbi:MULTISPECIES: TetR/AcrR family transcriptional regulator [Streptomyces]|jgi:AcrR family transcriptional regulator|uniref:TetR/AcrR family transcriptional regulator n=1 Tax=Streptomyces ortus TaxID=2867268 RepID=A0ABT3VDC4_9ACTN|nr:MULTISPECIES: TetR/AcrR family transcriptional regulator [Streptomyces]MCX4237821.1 TetR/AcrR family transcriptional regulator [Streptomyces ortus]
MSEQSEPAPTARTRPGGRTAAVRQRILRATIELAAQHGVERLNYEEIARTAGVNRVTVHRNWPDRNQLLQEALAEYAADSVPLQDTGDIYTDLTDYLCSMASTGESPVGRALLQTAMYSGDEPVIRELGLRLLEQRLSSFQSLLDRAVERGDLPPVDAAFLNQMLSGPVHLHLTRARTPFTREDAQRIVRFVLAGARATADVPVPDHSGTEPTA